MSRPNLSTPPAWSPAKASERSSAVDLAPAGIATAEAVDRPRWRYTDNEHVTLVVAVAALVVMPDARGRDLSVRALSPSQVTGLRPATQDVATIEREEQLELVGANA